MANKTLPSILYITDSTGYGGAEKYLIDVMGHFAKSSSVRLLLIGEGNAQLEKRVRELDIQILRFKQPSLTRLPQLFKTLWSLRNWLWHVNLTYYDSCRHVQLTSIVLPQTRMIATIHTLAEIDPIGGWRILKRRIRQKVFNRFNSVIAPSRYIGDKLVVERKFPRAKLKVIYNGVRVQSQAYRASSQLNSVPVIAVVARLHPDKGHKYLFEALAKLREKKVKFICQVIGEGPILDELKSQVEQLGITQEVQFLGFRADVDKLLQKSDILVLPSLPESENFPLTILEAMAIGLPVVATNVGGVPEQVVDGETGLLVDSGNRNQLAEALENVVSNSKFAEQMGVAGQQRFNELFTQKIMMDYLESVYLISE